METISLIIGVVIFLISIGIINVVRNFINWRKVEKKAKEDNKITEEEENMIKNARKLFFGSVIELLSMAFKTKINKKATPKELIGKIKEKM